MKEQAGAGAAGHVAHRQIVTEEVQDQVAVFQRLSGQFLNLTHGLVKRLGGVGGGRDLNKFWSQ